MLCIFIAYENQIETKYMWHSLICEIIQCVVFNYRIQMQTVNLDLTLDNMTYNYYKI